MIIQNIFKIKIHPLFYVFGLICTLTGLFKEFIVFSFIIITHEFGHILGGVIFKIYPEKIIILPFGGLTVFKMMINTSINKELVIAFMGPIFQILIWFIAYLSGCTNHIYNNYNLFILIFNLLPIYPLDGSKIFNLLINKFISFKRSFFITIYISFVSIFIFIFFIFYKNFNLGWLIILFFILIKIINEFFSFNNIFNKFLWERYNYDFNFKKQKTIKSIFFMKRDYKHILKKEGYFKTEKEFLRKRFDFKRKV